MHNLSDDELAVIAGTDKNAAYELIVRYLRRVELMAGRLSPEQNREQVCDDLIQEGLMALLGAMNTYRADKGGFAAYAGVCMRNSMYDHLSKRENKPDNEVTVTPEQLEEYLGADDSANPENIIIERERADELSSMVSNALSKREQQVFGLYLGGLGYGEIADRLGTDSKSVSNAMVRVRTKLREVFKDIK